MYTVAIFDPFLLNNIFVTFIFNMGDGGLQDKWTFFIDFLEQGPDLLLSREESSQATDRVYPG